MTEQQLLLAIAEQLKTENTNKKYFENLLHAHAVVTTIIALSLIAIFKISTLSSIVFITSSILLFSLISTALIKRNLSKSLKAI